ncbi:MAG: 50S ribosomal protein L1 [Candidatus Micrarchaeota archaeon]|nr:50S ribosomal protein L1 [Candidatus Micrarchaeota archaeon]
MEQELHNKFSSFVEANKGKRKFNQSVELAINFTGMDFSKQDNRLNLEVKLPNGKGKELKMMVFADDSKILETAQKAGAKTAKGSDLTSIATDKDKMNELLQYELIAQPSLMPLIAKSLGQFLGPRNKMPKPLIGADAATIIGNVAKSVYLRSKGKYLPTVHCMVGTEKMPVDEITANIDEVLNAVIKKVGKQHIKSVYAKLTMSEPMKLM